MSDPVAQQVQHFVGALGVAHRPVQVGDPRQTPPHQLELVHRVGIERAERLLGFGGVALPQQRAGQQLTGHQPAAAVHRGAGQPLTERDVGQRDRVARGGHQQVELGGLVAVEGQLRQPNSIRRTAQRLVLQRAHHLAAQPARRRHAQPSTDDLTEQRVVEPDVDAVVLLDDADQAAVLGVLDGLDTGDAAQRVQVQRLAERQQPQRVQHVVGQLIDAAVQAARPARR